MVQAVTRLFDNHADAAQAVRDLKAAGISDDDISLIANDAEGRGVDDDDDDDDDNETAEGAAEGATAGGLIGGGAGLLAGLGMLTIPGLGPVVAAGWLISTIAGAAAGAVAGGATGGILGALKDAGHSDDEAHVYAEGVRRGGTLVSVRPDTEARRVVAERVLSARSGVDAVTRGQAYRETGWSRFDETAAPYTAAEAAEARNLHAERRAFGAPEPMLEGDRIEDVPTDSGMRPVNPPLRGL